MQILKRIKSSKLEIKIENSIESIQYKINEDKILEIQERFYNSLKEDEVCIEIDKNSFYDESGLEISKPRRINIANVIWRFHKNDKNPFPSNPHGHSFNNKQVLNPYTGEIINRNNNKIIKKLKKKQLLFVQKELKRFKLL